MPGGLGEMVVGNVGRSSRCCMLSRRIGWLGPAYPSLGSAQATTCQGQLDPVVESMVALAGLRSVSTMPAHAELCQVNLCRACRLMVDLDLGRDMAPEYQDQSDVWAKWET